MNHLLLDWTTAGPYRNLSWVTIAFTAVVLLSIVFVVFELWDSYRTYRAVKQGNKNGGVLLLAESSLRRSMGRLFIQLSFFILAVSATFVSISANVDHLYWYRVTFVATFLISEFILCLLIVNDVLTRRRLEILIHHYYSRSDVNE